MSNIVFVGGFFPKEIEKDVETKSKEVIQNAANVFQWAFINGIEENLSHPIKLITAPFLGYFPRFYTSIFIKPFLFSHKEKSEDVSVGYCNLPVIKNVQKFFGLKKVLKTWASKKSDDKIIIVYGLDLAYLKAAISVKRRYSVHICLIITDLPDYPGDSGILYKMYIKYFEKGPTYKLLKKADSFVVLTEQMVEHFNLYKRPWIRIEGLYNFSASENQMVICNQKKRILMYTGTLDVRYGIEDLLAAFALVRDEDLELWICGGGMGKAMIERRAEKDKRIKYFGILPHPETKKLQMKATVLINPRNTSGTFNKYSFPSKTMEYFASGKPVILFKLEGIPEEYFKYCYTVSGNSIGALAETITTICNLSQDELCKKGREARAFIQKYKSGKMQCEKVLNMIGKSKNSIGSKSL